MTDRPIIFSGPMVQALLAGRKGMTRRLLKPQPHKPDQDMAGCRWRFTSGYKTTKANPPWMEAVRPAVYGNEIVVAPRRVPARIGDRLWVREQFVFQQWHGKFVGIDYCSDSGSPYLTYRIPPAGAQIKLSTRHEKKQPSIHMPRWASRLTLTVTGVKVERLQEISRADAIAEGLSLASANIEEFFRWPAPHAAHLWLSPIAAYEWLWNSLHGPDAWAANPWVVAVAFSVERKNIDGS